MDVYLTQGRTALFLAPLAIALLTLPFVSRQYRRFGQIGGWSGVVAMLVVLYGCGVVAFTLFPLPQVTPGFCAARVALATPKLQLFGSFADIARENVGAGLFTTLVSRASLQVMFNVLLFVPLGFLLRYRHRLGLARTTLAGFAGSLAVELTQLTGLWGLYPCPYRLFDIDDLWINTLGAVCGWLVAGPLSRLLPSAWPAPRTDVAPPSRARQTLGMLLDGIVWFFAAPITGLVLVQLYGLAAGAPLPEGSALRDWLPGLCYVLVGLALFVAMPAIRRDGATPGLAAVRLAVAEDGTSGSEPTHGTALVAGATPAGQASCLRRTVRTAAPYLGLIAVAAFGQASSSLTVLPLAAFAVLVLLEQRGVLSRWTGTSIVTRASLQRMIEQPREATPRLR
ncbi:VanZ family protein [Microtetraspora malaysiensis]|uniref:VanZ family protein n=1 Tax=Microtetraspora malaysiensis TaxID=161358 RepID=UPI003D91D5D5